MKIALVSQPIDTIFPPKQNSVGSCTLGIARALAPSAEVLVYGLQDVQEDPTALVSKYGIDFRFIPSTRRDRLLFRTRKEYAKLFPRSSPISTSHWLFPNYGRQVALDLKQQACDVIHLQHCSQYAPVIRALNPHAKIVLHLHAEWFSQSNPAIIANRLASVDLLTTVGQYVTEKTKLAFPFIATRCETTHNGVDVQEFPAEIDYGAGRSRTAKRILYSGAISPHKGLHVLFDAFVMVARQYPNVHLDVVGPIGNYPIEESFDLKDVETIKKVAPFYASNRWSLVTSKFRRHAPRQSAYLAHLKSRLPADVSEKVTVWGMIPRQQLLERYYSSDVFAFPPIWDEGFGLPPVEAMAAGLPVVSSRSGTVVETVVDGVTGFLIEKDNAEQLAQALLTLLKDDARREAMGRAGRHRVLQCFTWERVAADVLARYKKLCQPASSRVPSDYAGG